MPEKLLLLTKHLATKERVSEFMGELENILSEFGKYLDGKEVTSFTRENPTGLWPITLQKVVAELWVKLRIDDHEPAGLEEARGIFLTGDEMHQDLEDMKYHHGVEQSELEVLDNLYDARDALKEYKIYVINEDIKKELDRVISILDRLIMFSKSKVKYDRMRSIRGSRRTRFI